VSRCSTFCSSGRLRRPLSANVGRRTMSFDLAVWPREAVASTTDAEKLYLQLCNDPGTACASLPASAGLEGFYQELTALHPQIDDISEEGIDNTDLCPWSIAFDRSDRHILMCSVWSKADYVESLVRDLAHKHGLAMFNPQARSLHLPSQPLALATSRPWWKIW